MGRGVFMKPIRYLGVALLFVLGCQGLPTVTRTGNVKDVSIGDNLTSGDIVVNPGDEVRWVNKRTAPVRIVLIDPVSEKQVSCKSNFGGLMTPSDTAKLATNQTASICFRDAGTFRYTVRMESARETGELNVPGVVKVGGQGGQAVEQTNDQNRTRSSGQSSARTTEPSGNKPGDQTEPASSTSITTTTTTTTIPPKTNEASKTEEGVVR
jgi:plastocyanin